MTKSELLKSVFHRDHVIRALWSFAIALVFFILGMWFSSKQEPSRVIVVNTPDLRDTVVLRLEGDQSNPNQSITKYLAQMSRDINELRQSYRSTSTGTPKYKLETLKPSMMATQKGRPVKLETVPVPTPLRLASVQIPTFSFPPGVKGYLADKITAFAKVALEAASVQKGHNLDVVFELLDTSIVGRTTPIFVEVVRKDAELSYTQIASRQYVMSPGKNLIRWVVDFPPGNYELEVGFSFITELDKEYPARYRSLFAISVKDEP